MGGSLKDIWKILTEVGLIILFGTCVVAGIVVKIKNSKEPIENVDFTEGTASIRMIENLPKGPVYEFNFSEIA